MKRFEFRLARLARVRAAEEEIARNAWQSAEARFRTAEEKVEHVLQDLDSATEDLRRAQSDAQLAPTEVLAIQTSMEHLDSILRCAREQAETLRVAADEAREPWQALRIELESLSRLEGKQRAKHRREMEREETKQMDQIASERVARTPAGLSRGRAAHGTPESRRLGARTK